jgi:hypothetical protein
MYDELERMGKKAALDYSKVTNIPALTWKGRGKA